MTAFFDLVRGALAKAGTDATGATLEGLRGLLRNYWCFLKKATIYFAVALATLMALFVLGRGPRVEAGQGARDVLHRRRGARLGPRCLPDRVDRNQRT
jgi:hypothetical protein